jgi:hypothetical protein
MLSLSSRGWVGPVPGPLLLGKSGDAGNRTRDLKTRSKGLWPVDTEAINTAAHSHQWHIIIPLSFIKKRILVKNEQHSRSEPYSLVGSVLRNSRHLVNCSRAYSVCSLVMFRATLALWSLPSQGLPLLWAAQPRSEPHSHLGSVSTDIRRSANSTGTCSHLRT